MRTRCRKRYLRRQGGQVMVEFAAVFVLFLVLILGIADAGRAFVRVHQMTQIAREIARIASMTPNITDPAVKNSVKNRARVLWQAKGILPDDIQINVDATAGVLEVAVMSPFRDAVGVSIVPYFNGVRLTARISMPLLVQTP